MGYESIKNIRHVELRDFSAGWFPGKPFNEIPGRLEDGSLIGAIDCTNMAWYRGALRKMFGFIPLTTNALNGSVSSLFYSHVLDTVVGTAGTKIYTDMDSTAPTDITGALTLSNSGLICWAEWRFATDEYVIGTDGVNPLFYYDGTGNAVVVPGSPPTGKFITAWQDALWVADGDTLRFSAIGSVTSWDAQDNYRFDAPIRGLGRLNKQLVVFFDDHIGVLEGDNNRLLDKVNRYVDGIGTSSHFTIKNARFKDIDVLVFHTYDGIYAYDGSQIITKTSFPIEEKYVNNSETTRWNHAAFNKAVSVYDINYDWYHTALADGASSTNDVVLIQDLKRPMTVSVSAAVPHWICTDLGKSITFMEFSRSLDKRGNVLLGTTEGKVYKMDEAVYTRDGAGYDCFFKTKLFDNVVTFIVQELSILGFTASNAGVELFINTGLEEDDGISGEVDFQENADPLDLLFIMGVSTLAGAAYSLQHAPVNSWGRYLQFKVQSVNSAAEMTVLGLDVILNNIGLLPNAKER
jgi:hypothetical protein